MAAWTPAVRERSQGRSDLAPAWLPRFLATVKLHLLLADGEITVIEFFGNRIKSIAEIKVDKGWFLVLHFVQSGRLLKLPAQIRELVIAPYRLQAKLFALRLVPGVVE